MEGPTNTATLTIRFKTTLPDPDLQVGSGVELSVPGSLGRNGLRAVLRVLLDSDGDSSIIEKIDGLEFLVGDRRERLRTTLYGFCTRRGLSLETVKEVEYFLPIGKPEEKGEAKIGDTWICGLSVVKKDGIARVIAGDMAGGCALMRDGTIAWKGAGHSGSVKGVCWVGEGEMWVSGAGDETVGVWTWDDRGNEGRKVGEFSSDDVADGTGFECVAAMPSEGSKNTLIAAGGFNGSLWTLDVSKLADHVRESDLGKRTTSDVQTLVGRRLEMTRQDVCLSSLSWRGEELLSASWDGLVRVWDVERGTIVRSVPGGGKPLTDIAWSGERLAATAFDGIVRLIDTNAKGTAGSGSAVLSKSGRLKSHAGLANTVVWLGDGDELASGGHDGTIRIWDARSMAAPLRILENVHGEGGRCLSLTCYSNEGKRILLSGGSDGKIKHFAFT